MKKSATLRTSGRSRTGQKDFHLEYRKSLKTQRGTSIKEVPEGEEQNRDLKTGPRAKKTISPKKGPIGPVTIDHHHYGISSSTVPAPELEAGLQPGATLTSFANKDFEAYKKNGKIPKI